MNSLLGFLYLLKSSYLFFVVTNIGLSYSSFSSNSIFFFCSLTNLLKILFLGSHHLFLMLARVQSVFFYVLQLYLLLDFQLFLFVFWMLSQEVNSMVSTHFWTPKSLDFIPYVGSSFYKKLFSCISHLQLLM